MFESRATGRGPSLRAYFYRSAAQDPWGDGLSHPPVCSRCVKLVLCRSENVSRTHFATVRLSTDAEPRVSKWFCAYLRIHRQTTRLTSWTYRAPSAAYGTGRGLAWPA